MSYKIELLDEARRVLGVTTDYALASALGLDVTSLYTYRTRPGTLPENEAITLACAVGRHPFYVIARLRMDKMREGIAFEFWAKVAEKFSGPYTAEAQTVSKIVKTFAPVP